MQISTNLDASPFPGDKQIYSPQLDYPPDHLQHLDLDIEGTLQTPPVVEADRLTAGLHLASLLSQQLKLLPDCQDLSGTAGSICRPDHVHPGLVMPAPVRRAGQEGVGSVAGQL